MSATEKSARELTAIRIEIGLKRAVKQCARIEGKSFSEMARALLYRGLPDNLRPRNNYLPRGKH